MTKPNVQLKRAVSLKHNTEVVSNASESKQPCKEVQPEMMKVDLPAISFNDRLIGRPNSTKTLDKSEKPLKEHPNLQQSSISSSFSNHQFDSIPTISGPINLAHRQPLTITVPQQIQCASSPGQQTVPTTLRAIPFHHVTRVTQVPLKRVTLANPSSPVCNQKNQKPESTLLTSHIHLNRMIALPRTSEIASKPVQLMKFETPKQSTERSKDPPAKPKRLYKRKQSTPLTPTPMMQWDPSEISLNDDFTMMPSPAQSDKMSTESQSRPRIDPVTGLTQETMKKRRLMERYEKLLGSERGLEYRLEALLTLTKNQIAGLLSRSQKYLETIDASEDLMLHFFETRANNQKAQQRRELMDQKMKQFNRTLQQKLDKVLNDEKMDVHLSELEKLDGDKGADSVFKICEIAEELDEESDETSQLESHRDLLVTDRLLVQMYKDLTRKQQIVSQELDQISTGTNCIFLDLNGLDKNLPDEQERCARCRPIKMIRRQKIVKRNVEEFDSEMNVFDRMRYASNSADDLMERYLEELALQIKFESSISVKESSSKPTKAKQSKLNFTPLHESADFVKTPINKKSNSDGNDFAQSRQFNSSKPTLETEMKAGSVQLSDSRNETQFETPKSRKPFVIIQELVTRKSEVKTPPFSTRKRKVASKSTKKQGTKRKLETPRFSDPYAEEFDKKRFEQSLKRFAGQYKYKDIDLPGFRLFDIDAQIEKENAQKLALLKVSTTVVTFTKTTQ